MGRRLQQAECKRRTDVRLQQTGRTRREFHEFAIRFYRARRGRTLSTSTRMVYRQLHELDFPGAEHVR